MSPRDDQRVLVTGATGHLGRAVVHALARQGSHVLVNGRTAERVDPLVEEVRAGGGSAEALVLDVTDAEAVAALGSSPAVDGLTGVVNNAYAGGAGSIETASDDDYAAAYGVTVVAAQRLVRVLLGSLRESAGRRGDAAVVNVGSMYGLVSPDPRVYASPEVANPPFYGAAKAALAQWTRYAATELGPQGVRVNTVTPGPFPQDPVHAADPAFVERLARRVPLGRVGRAAEIAGPVLFLLSPAASFVNGADMVVDGGWTAW